MNEGMMGCFLDFFPLDLVSFAALKPCKNHRILLVGKFEVPAIEFLCFFLLPFFLKDTQITSKAIFNLIVYTRHLKGCFHPGIFYFPFFHSWATSRRFPTQKLPLGASWRISPKSLIVFFRFFHFFQK